MEASAIPHPPAVRGPAPLLRLAGDERLVALTRRGHVAAFEALVGRYQARLLAFCRHMLGSREDAEDVLQEVFAAAFNAMLADERPINVRPWLYRIARNRSLNHLRRTQAVGVDSMDVHVAENGTTTAEKAHRREDFRLLVADVQTLAESQRTALLLREIDALSYAQIAEAMETTIPSVKSLLVRARVALAEAAEARALSCAEVRQQLGEVAEGLQQRLAAPARRHVRGCQPCAGFRQQLRATNRALAAVLPVGPLLFLKKALLAQLGTTASAGGAAGSAAMAGGGAAAAGGTGALSAGITAVASKTAAGLAAAAIVTAGAVEVNQTQDHPRHAPVTAVARTPAAPPVVVDARPEPAGAPFTGGVLADPAAIDAAREKKSAADKAAADKAAAVTGGAASAAAPADGSVAGLATPSPAIAATPGTPAIEQQWDATMLPADDRPATGTGGAAAPGEPQPAPAYPPPAGSPAPTDSAAPTDSPAPSDPPPPSDSPPPAEPAPTPLAADPVPPPAAAPGAIADGIRPDPRPMAGIASSSP